MTLYVGEVPRVALTGGYNSNKLGEDSQWLLRKKTSVFDLFNYWYEEEKSAFLSNFNTD